jgi:hypothetical protein
MPDTSIDSVLARLGRAISRGDALTALRRAQELETLVRRLPGHVLPQVRDRLAVVTSSAERLRGNCSAAVKDSRRQRQSVVAYRELAERV